MDLTSKKCIPCSGGIPPMDDQQITKFLKSLGNNWQINNQKHLFKSFKFQNFIQAVEFTNKITEIAEKEGHHPDLHISWGECNVEIWTHKINGLTESDFYLAAKIDKILP